MLLHHRIQGNGPSLIILHGLFGSMDNWRSLAPKLASQFQVITVDLPNHGYSPHKEVFSYPSLARDLVGFMDRQEVDTAALLGHSLGGKIGMQCALDFPERIKCLLVVDIAPRAYPPEHLSLFEALSKLDPSVYHSRREIDKALAASIPNPAVRQFLLMNLDKKREGYRWRINLEGLHRNYCAICAAVSGEGLYHDPVLFVKGERSNYIRENDEVEIRRYFPKAEITSIPRAGHWVHADAPDAFMNTVFEFLSQKGCC